MGSPLTADDVPPVPPPWIATRDTGSATTFHARPIPDPADHLVWILDVDQPAVVLGSSQRPDAVDPVAASAAGIEVVTRRSGGGAVALEPGVDCWIDVIVPAGSPVWHNDVGRAFDWLGAVWTRTINDLLAARSLPMLAAPHTGAFQPGELGRLVCFASLGPGEVVVEGAKVVGISQRRTRSAARFQSNVVWRWRPELLQHVLATDAETRAAIDRVAAGGLPAPAPTPAEIAARFCANLPTIADDHDHS
ncbi:MAG: hypothetical protein AAF467_10800 [Actinomycetota bacterium]